MQDVLIFLLWSPGVREKQTKRISTLSIIVCKAESCSRQPRTSQAFLYLSGADTGPLPERLVLLNVISSALGQECIKKISFAADLAFNNHTNKSQSPIKSRTTSGVQPMCCWFTSTTGCWKTGLSPRMLPIPTVPEMLFRKPWAGSCWDIWGLDTSMPCLGTPGFTALLIKTQRNTHISFQLELLLCKSKVCAGHTLFAAEKK